MPFASACIREVGTLIFGAGWEGYLVGLLRLGLRAFLMLASTCEAMCAVASVSAPRGFPCIAVPELR